MAIDPYKILLADVQHKIDEVEANIACLQAELSELVTIANYIKHNSPSIQEAGIAAESGEVRPAVSVKGMTQTDAAAKILRVANKPMKTGDLVERMIEGGFGSTDRKKLKTTLYTAMIRKPDTFVRDGPGLWRLAKQTNSNGTLKPPSHEGGAA